MNVVILKEQYLPTYKDNFKKDPRWITRESTHYIFNFFPDSIASLEIDKIEKIQEESLESNSVRDFSRRRSCTFSRH